MSEPTYKCEACGGTFEKAWSDEEAQAEKERDFGDMPSRDLAIVCDVCYREIMGLPPIEDEDKK